jgi:hypothetical protein
VAFSASVPVQLPKTTASTRDHAIRFKEAAIASRSLSMNQRVIESFLRTGFWHPQGPRLIVLIASFRKYASSSQCHGAACG